MPGKPPIGTKGIGFDNMVPKAKLDDVQPGSLTVICDDERVTLTTGMSLDEFRAARSRIDEMLLRLVMRHVKAGPSL